MDEIIGRLNSLISIHTELLYRYYTNRDYDKIGQQKQFVDGLKLALVVAQEVKAESDAAIATSSEIEDE